MTTVVIGIVIVTYPLINKHIKFFVINVRVLEESSTNTMNDILLNQNLECL